MTLLHPNCWIQGHIFETLNWNMFQIWSLVERFWDFGCAGVTSLFQPKPNQGRESVTDRISRWRKGKHQHDQGAICKQVSGYQLTSQTCFWFWVTKTRPWMEHLDTTLHAWAPLLLQKWQRMVQSVRAAQCWTSKELCVHGFCFLFLLFITCCTMSTIVCNHFTLSWELL